MAQDDCKSLIKQSIREETMGLCEIMVSHVSKWERQEIQTKFGSPTVYREDEFIDMTDWVKG